MTTLLIFFPHFRVNRNYARVCITPSCLSLYYANTRQVNSAFAMYGTVIYMHWYCQKRNIHKIYTTGSLKEVLDDTFTDICFFFFLLCKVKNSAAWKDKKKKDLFSELIGLDGNWKVFCLLFVAFHPFSLHVVHNHPGSLCWRFVAVMAFTASVAIMGYKNDIIKSPGSAPRPVRGLSLQSSPIVTLLRTRLRILLGKLLFCPLKWFPRQFSDIIIW